MKKKLRKRRASVGRSLEDLSSERKQALAQLISEFSNDQNIEAEAGDLKRKESKSENIPSLQNQDRETHSLQRRGSQSRTPKYRRQINLAHLFFCKQRGVHMSEIASLEGYDDLTFTEGEALSSEERRQNKTFRKRFQRDRKDLESLGIEIEQVSDPEKEKALFRLKSSSLISERIEFELEEHVLIDALATYYPELKTTLLGKFLFSAITKLKAGSRAQGVAFQKTKNTYRQVAVLKNDLSKLDKCFLACAQRKALRFFYMKAGEMEKSLRVVEPWGFVRRNLRCYLVGYDQGAQEQRVFRLSRIKGKVEILTTEEPFELPDDLKLESYFSAMPLSGGRQAIRKIGVRFDHEIGFIIENEFKGIYPMTRKSDGSVVMTIPAAYPLELYQYLADFAGYFEIFTPPSLAYDFQARLEETLTLYE